MHRNKYLAILWAAALAAPLDLLAQSSGIPAGHDQPKNEVGLLIGLATAPGQTVVSGSPVSPNVGLSFDPSLNFTVEYTRRVHQAKSVEVLAGVDVAVSPLDVKLSSGPPAARNQYAYLFLTPEIRLRFLPRSRVHPWLSTGAGLANYAESQVLINGESTNSPDTTHAAVQFSGGVDSSPIHLLLPVSFRAEVRDYFAGKPNLGLDTGGGFSNNIVFAGGIVLNF